MSVTTEKYIKNAIVVEAVRVTGTNINDIAEWCHGEVKQDEVPGKGTGKKYVKVRVHNPINKRQTKAFVGDWILYTERGYKIYTNKAFHSAFTKATNAHREFPFEEGDVIVIGPNCFAAKDGSVICWKGENYEPQGSGISVNEAREAAKASEELEQV